VNLTRRARGLAYRTFYSMPGVVRRRIVRLISPKYLVGAVTLVHDSEAPEPGRLLLLRQPPGRGWGLPAGLLKHREEPVVGAARELFEESGVRLDPEALAPAVPNAVVHVKGWVDTVFTASVPASTTALVVDGGEVLEARWFPLDALPPLTLNAALLLGVYGIGPEAPSTEARPGTGETGTGLSETGAGAAGAGEAGPGAGEA
jgi:ADP-ribose pyrophosphatase YjhB (NUDIX family)